MFQLTFVCHRLQVSFSVVGKFQQVGSSSESLDQGSAKTKKLNKIDKPLINKDIMLRL